MNEYIRIIKNSEFKTGTWSGGTTTQLMIYPEGASYSKHNFKWRISSARVETEESVFTHLPGITRVIMIIEGKLTLEHEGKYRVNLKPFEQDSFMGDWTTRSYGRVTDFNLMISTGCSGKLNALSVEIEGILNIIPNACSEDYENVTNLYYAANGNFEVRIQDTRLKIHKGDLLSLTGSNGNERPEITFLNKSNKKINIIEAVIHY